MDIGPMFIRYNTVDGVMNIMVEMFFTDINFSSYKLYSISPLLIYLTKFNNVYSAICLLYTKH